MRLIGIMLLPAVAMVGFPATQVGAAPPQPGIEITDNVVNGCQVTITVTPNDDVHGPHILQVRLRDVEISTATTVAGGDQDLEYVKGEAQPAVRTLTVPSGKNADDIFAGLYKGRTAPGPRGAVDQAFSSVSVACP